MILTEAQTTFADRMNLESPFPEITLENGMNVNKSTQIERTLTTAEETEYAGPKTRGTKSPANTNMNTAGKPINRKSALNISRTYKASLLTFPLDKSDAVFGKSTAEVEEVIGRKCQITAEATV